MMGRLLAEMPAEKTAQQQRAIASAGVKLPHVALVGFKGDQGAVIADALKGRAKIEIIDKNRKRFESGRTDHSLGTICIARHAEFDPGRYETNRPAHRPQRPRRIWRRTQGGDQRDQAGTRPIGEIMARFGIWDTKDNCWLGNKEGPLLFDDDGTCPGGKVEPGNGELMAKLAARVIDVQAHQSPGRCRERLFAERSVVYKDDIPVHCSSEKALEDLEAGRVL